MSELEDKELEKNILSIIEAHFKPSDNSLMPLNATKRVMQLITADRKRVALEARIDELSNAQDELFKGAKMTWFTNRRVELKAQLEEV